MKLTMCFEENGEENEGEKANRDQNLRPLLVAREVHDQFNGVGNVVRALEVN
jgi:hypothetical protein